MKNKRVPGDGELSEIGYGYKGRRFACLVLAGLMALCLCACGEYEEYVLKRSEELHRETPFGVEPVKEDNEEVVTVPDEKDIYVTVPAEAVYLKNAASEDGVSIQRLPAGTYLKRDSTDMWDGDSGFYKVSILGSETEGYVPADSCTRCAWIFDGIEQPVVDTESELYSYDEMVKDIKELCSRYEDRLSFETAGKSADGRDIYLLHLGNPGAENRIFIDAAIHGREYISAQLTMALIEYYASQYYNGCYHNRSYSELFDKICFDIIPMANPDGVTISQYGEEGLRDRNLREKLRECYQRDKDLLVYQEDGNGTMYWADYYKIENYDKSALPEELQKEIGYEDYLTQWKSNARAVDINTNFDAGWEETKYKDYPSYGMSKGKDAGSEPETQILMRESQRYDYSCYVNYHSRGQIIYYDSFGMSGLEIRESKALANSLSQFNLYTLVSTGDDGVDKAGFGDYVHIVLKKPGVTIEIGREPSPVPVSELKGIFFRNRETWAMMAFSYW